MNKITEKMVNKLIGNGWEIINMGLDGKQRFLIPPNNHQKRYWTATYEVIDYKNGLLHVPHYIDSSDFG